MHTRILAVPASILVALALIQGCGDDKVTNPLPPELQQLKESLSAYADIDAAKAAGFDTQITPCWYDHTQGAMGYHWGNVGRIDGTPSLQEPEALIYEPQQNGSMLLVGLEYIVPIPAWTGSAPPRLVGQDYIKFDDLGVYALHIYLYKDNPAGMYAPWNPDISCQYAEESEDLAPSGSARTHAHVMD